MDQKDSSSPLSDNLLALPRWAVWATLGLLALGVALGFTFLIVPNLNNALRSAGGSLLVISLPALALSIGLLGSSWARTERIDAMTARFLYHTVGDKLESNLVGSTSDTPLFVRMERRAEKKTTSFCYYSLFDDKNRRFDIFAKSNVFNFEIAMALHLDTDPVTFAVDMPRKTYQLSSQDEWPAPSTNPLVDLVSSTLYGSLLWPLPRRCRFVPPCGPGIQLEVPAARAVSARARTNELDSGKRCPFMRSEEQLPAGVGLGLLGVG